MEIDNFDLAEDLGDLDNIDISNDYDWDTEHLYTLGLDDENGCRNDGSGEVGASSNQTLVNRARDGRCAECGSKTHEIQVDKSGQAVKVPLSVPLEVHRERCLLCHPLPNNNGIIRRDTHRSSGELDNGLIRRDARRSSGGTENGLVRRDTHKHSLASDNGLTRRDTHQSSLGSDNGLLRRDSHQSTGGSVGTHASQKLSSSQSACSQNAPGTASGLTPVPFAPNQDPLNQTQDKADGILSSITFHRSNQVQQQQQDGNDGLRSVRGQFLTQQQSRSFHRSTLSTSPLDSSSPDNTALETAIKSMQGESLNIERVIQIMQRFPSHAIIQERGCAIFLSQTQNADSCKTLSSKECVVTILQAMREHPSINTLQYTAIEGLQNLCMNETSSINSRQTMLQSGGLPQVVDTMQILVDDAEIQRSGCNLLSSLAQGGMEYKIGVAECGGILAVTKAVEKHSDNDNLLRAAYQALRLLGYNPTGGGVE